MKRNQLTPKQEWGGEGTEELTARSDAKIARRKKRQCSSPSAPTHPKRSFLSFSMLLYAKRERYRIRSRIRGFNVFYVNHLRLLIELARYFHRLALERPGALRVV